MYSEEIREEFTHLLETVRGLRERGGDSLLLSELDNLEEGIENLRDLCFPPPTPFYPPTGTTFVVKGGTIPYVVVGKDIAFENSPGGISYNHPECGICEYLDWIESVRDGGVTVVWCVKGGKVPSNGEWLASWGLA